MHKVLLESNLSKFKMGCHIQNLANIYWRVERPPMDSQDTEQAANVLARQENGFSRYILMNCVPLLPRQEKWKRNFNYRCILSFYRVSDPQSSICLVRCQNLDHQDLLSVKVRTNENRMTQVALIEGNFVYIIGVDVSMQIDANLSLGCLLLRSGNILKCKSLI